MSGSRLSGLVRGESLSLSSEMAYQLGLNYRTNSHVGRFSRATVGLGCCGRRAHVRVLGLGAFHGLLKSSNQNKVPEQSHKRAPIPQSAGVN